MTAQADPAAQPLAHAGRRARLGWAVGDFGFNIYWQALNLLMLPFYTDVLGLDARLAGTVFLLASLWDGLADSIIGAVADRTRSRHGSYRPYLLWGPPFMLLAFIAAFAQPDATGQAGLFAWALGSQIVLRTVYSLVSIPYSSLSARITTDPDERASAAGLRIAFAMLGGIVVTFLMPTLVGRLEGVLAERAYMAAAGAAALLSLPFFWICFASTHEPERLVEANPRGFSARAVHEDVAAIVTMLRANGPLLRVFGCLIVSSLAFTMTNKCLVYYATHWLGRPDLTAAILPLALFTNLVFCLVWARIARLTSKRSAWLMANAVSAVAYLLFWALPTRDPMAAGVLIALISVGNAAYITLVWAMLPDTVEYGEWRTGRRHDAKLFGVASFAKQLALGLNGFLLGWLLAAAGYVEKAPVQSDAAIAGLRAIMTFVPLAGLALSALLIAGYRLDAATHRRITRDLEARRP